MPTKAERKAAEEKRKREAAAAAAKRGPKIAPKRGKFVASREQQDESLRVVALFKSFAERGKVPAALVPNLVKELFKGAGSKELVGRLAAAAKEALTSKAAASGQMLTTGDFSGWYFEAAWPAIIEERQEAKATAAAAKKEAEAAAKAAAEAAAEEKAAQEAEEAAAAAAAAEKERLAEEVRKAEATREEEARLKAEAEEQKRNEAAMALQNTATPPGARPPKQQAKGSRPPSEPLPGQQQAKQAKQQHAGQTPHAPPGQPGSQPGSQRSQPRSQRAAGDASSSSTNIIVQTTGLEVDLPPEPVGWVAARGIDVAESRRLIPILAAHAMAADDGPRGGGEAEGEIIHEIMLPEAEVEAALSEALLPAEDDALLAQAPRAAVDGGGVHIGALVAFWFEIVYPKHAATLSRDRDALSPESQVAPVELE